MAQRDGPARVRFTARTDGRCWPGILAKAGYAGYYCFEWEKKWRRRDGGTGSRVSALARDQLARYLEGRRHEARIACRADLWSPCHLWRRFRPMRRFPVAITDEFATDNLIAALRAMRDVGMTGADSAYIWGGNINRCSRTRSSTSMREPSRVHGRAGPSPRVAAAQCVPARRSAGRRPLSGQDVFGSTYTFEDQPRLTRRAFNVGREERAPESSASSPTGGPPTRRASSTGSRPRFATLANEAMRRGAS